MSFEFMTMMIYSPRGDSDNAKKSKIAVGMCKNGNMLFAQRIAELIREKNAEEYFENSSLVPIPRSTPLIDGAVFPAKVLAEILVKNGLGNFVYTCLKRTKAIEKSSSNFSAKTRNSVPTHLESMAVEPLLISEPTIILIDDVFTLGRTAMASAMKLQAEFPDKTIKIFCPFRTRGFEDNNILLSFETHFMSLSNDGNGVQLPD